MPQQILPIPHSPDDLDDGGVCHRIGLLALSTDVATEADFHRMLPGPEVMFHTARVRQINPLTAENLRKMGPLLGDAAATIAEGQPLDVIAYSCTSGSVVLGSEAVAAEIQRGCPGVTVVNPIDSALAACAALGLRRVSLVTPYIPALTQTMADYIESRGQGLASVANFALEDDITMARLSPAAIRRGARAFCAPDADGLFISCTAIRAAETVAALEAELGRPVLTSIQCLFWAALRASGYQAPVWGHGRLLELATDPSHTSATGEHLLCT